jgi:hypothetical protein
LFVSQIVSAAEWPSSPNRDDTDPKTCVDSTKPNWVAQALIRPVGGELGVALGLQPLAREQQPILARAGNRIAVLPAALLELAARFPRPALARLCARDDPLGVEFELILRLGDRLRFPIGPRLLAGLARSLLASAAEDSARPSRVRNSSGSSSPRSSPYSTSSASSVAFASAKISRAISPKSRVDSRLAFPAIRVPSIATIPA